MSVLAILANGLVNELVPGPHHCTRSSSGETDHVGCDYITPTPLISLL